MWPHPSVIDMTDLRSATEHDRYSVLCALATSGTLSEHEWELLRIHLQECDVCRKELSHYREISRTAMALLMPDDGGVMSAHAWGDNSWSPAAAKQELSKRLARGGGAFEKGNGRSDGVLLGTPVQAPWFQASSQVLQRYAAALFVVMSLAAGVYWISTNRSSRADSGWQSNSQVNVLGEFARLKADYASVQAALASRTADFNRASADASREAADAAQWKSVAEQARADAGRSSSERDLIKAQAALLLQERDGLAHKLEAAQNALEASQRQIETLRQTGSGAEGRVASLERRIEDLTAQLAVNETESKQARQFLASDRDVRELMGARDLYIADVFDVGQNGKTQKTFGRVFYTKGKSLVFYAFDLDQEPNVANASIFQAWGRRGMTDRRPLNMGIFYLDNENKKRWVLRFDDPAALAQIDAVFVTVEPRGGNQKPSGKQLLFASLRSTPNHP